jgi:hypothetical protein
MEVGEVLNIEGPARKWSWFQGKFKMSVNVPHSSVSLPMTVEVYDAVNAIGSKGCEFSYSISFWSF